MKRLGICILTFLSVFAAKAENPFFGKPVSDLLSGAVTLKQGTPPACSTQKKMVFAHFVPWFYAYNNFAGRDRGYEFSVQHDATLMESCKREIALAQAAGIDCFLFNTAGNGDEGQSETMRKAAEGTSFLVGFCLDFHNGGKTAVADITQKMEKLIDKYCSHPNYPKVDGKPLFFTFASNRRKPEAIAEIRNNLKAKGKEIFLVLGIDGLIYNKNYADYVAASDGTYFFQPSHLSWHDEGEPAGIDRNNYLRMKEFADAKGKIVVPCIAPGYLGRWLNEAGSNMAYIPPRGFDKMFDGYQAFQPGESNWLHVTTWNDYDETAVYPRLFDFGTALEMIQAFTQDFRKSSLSDRDEPRLYFAAIRETIPGTLLRIEAVMAPIARKGNAKVSGRLLNNEGKEIADLKPVELSLEKLTRHEWLTPTVALAKEHALIPEITMTYPDRSGKQITVTRKLPAILFRTPWIQNQSTVKSTFHAMADIASELSVTQKGHLLDAKLKINTKEKVTRAILLRNDRVIGEFENTSAGRVLNFSLFAHRLHKDHAALNKTTKVDFENCSVRSSLRRFHYFGDMKAKEEGNSLIFSRYVRGIYKTQIVCHPDARIVVTSNGTEVGTFTPEELLKKSVFATSDNDTSFDITNAHLYSPVNPEVLKNDTELELKLYTQTPRPGDVFQVLFITEDNKTAYSRFVAPFQKEQLRRMNVLNTWHYQDSKNKNMGYLRKRTLRRHRVAETQVNTLSFRSSLWNFNGGDLERFNKNGLDIRIFAETSKFWNDNVFGMDSLGERPIHEGFLRNRIQKAGPDGSPCLVLKEKDVVSLLGHVYPLAGGTIELKLNIDKLPAKPQKFIHSNGYLACAYHFTLLPDGTVTVGRRCDTPVKSKTKLVPGSWYTIRFVSHEDKGDLYINGTLDASGELTPMRDYHSGRLVLGDKANGFAGKIDDFFMSGIPFMPQEKITDYNSKEVYVRN